SRFPARVDLDGAHCLGFARILRAMLAIRPGRANPADKIKAGIRVRWQLDRDLALPHSVSRLAHGLLRRAPRPRQYHYKEVASARESSNSNGARGFASCADGINGYVPVLFKKERKPCHVPRQS